MNPASISMAALQWLMAQAGSEGTLTSSDTAAQGTSLGSGQVLLVDVRSVAEFQTDHIAGAIHVPVEVLAMQISALAELRRQVVLYCASGSRSRAGAEQLRAMGYQRVWVLSEPFPITPTSICDTTEPTTSERRYARQEALFEVGSLGQARLRAARVLVIGLGGLGSPVALYLAAAGIGALDLSDSDEVELSNLQRQILHTTPRVGSEKTASAQIALRALNPAVEVTLHPRADPHFLSTALTGEHRFDVIVDGSDNLATRYAVSDAAFTYGVPVVHGSVFRFEGLVTTLMPRAAAQTRKLASGPCYRCIFPEAQKTLSVSCAQAGVLGATCGVIGSLMATEVIKLVLGIGEPLIGALLTYDGLRTQFSRIAIPDHCRHNDSAGQP